MTVPDPADVLSEPARVLRDLVDVDLSAGRDDGRLHLAAMQGEEPLLVAVSRAFAKGAYDAPFIEVASLALGMGADRLALAVTARAWSQRDPVPPVTEDVDLRQRVLCVHEADGSGDGAPVVGGWLLPFAVEDERVTWAAPVEVGRGEGWLVDALATVVAQRHEVEVTAEEVLTQFARCERLGHDLLVFERGAERLLAAAQA